MIEGENEFMTDVLFYQNYTYVADISAIVLCIICWLLLHSSYTVREKSLIIFKAGTVCLMMATVCSISFHTAITRITESRKILIYVLQDGIYLLLILTFVLLCNYFGTLLKLEERPARLLGAVSWGGYAVFAFLEIGSPFTHLGFYIDADLMVHQNFYFDPFRFAYLLLYRSCRCAFYVPEEVRAENAALPCLYFTVFVWHDCTGGRICIYIL